MQENEARRIRNAIIGAAESPQARQVVCKQLGPDYDVEYVPIYGEVSSAVVKVRRSGSNQWTYFRVSVNRIRTP